MAVTAFEIILHSLIKTVSDNLQNNLASVIWPKRVVRIKQENRLARRRRRKPHRRFTDHTLVIHRDSFDRAVASREKSSECCLGQARDVSIDYAQGRPAFTTDLGSLAPLGLQRRARPTTRRRS